MLNKQSPITVICVFCGWDKVVSPQHLYVAMPKCEQCGCDEMLMKPVGSFAKLLSSVKGLFT